jgi:activator of HSP90 ATPase
MLPHLILMLDVRSLKQEVTTIKQTVIIPKASPKQVYDAYVDPKKHSEFTDSKATGKPKVGGKYSSWDGYIFGKYLVLDDGKRVVQDWTTTDWEEGYPASKLELTFNAVPGGTEIVMVHSNVPKVQAVEVEQGWTEFYWEPLKEYFSEQAKT